jgi:hypothetical protein
VDADRLALSSPRLLVTVPADRQLAIGMAELRTHFVPRLPVHSTVRGSRA